MSSGIYTWDTLPLGEPLLVVLNSAKGDTAAADALWAALATRVPAGVMHVIAERHWADWLAAHGITADRILYCADYEGRDVEVNYFLQSPAAVLWTVTKQIRNVIGSDPYDLHNERVNPIFEQPALLLIGEGGRLLAHALPTTYVYAFDLAQLLERCGRGEKVRDYERTARALVADLHQTWLAAGRPARNDQPDFSDVMPVLARHLGAPVLTYDEAGPIPIAAPSLLPGIAGVITRIQSVMREHDRQLQVWADAYAERREAADVREAGITLRDEMIDAARKQAADDIMLRDKIIDALRLQLEPWHRKLRRRLAGRG